MSVVMIRDGYLLPLAPPCGTWIPEHALEPPFDAAAAAAFLRSRGMKYRVINRAVGRGA